MIRFHTLRRRQWIPRPIDEVFAFFSDARNPEEITPPWLRFHILTRGPMRIAEGTRIRYRLRLHGIPVGWMTDIVRYRLPLGIIGRLVHRLKVRRDVERIFDHRAQRIPELFRAATLEAQ